jgi:hypothetical protein
MSIKNNSTFFYLKPLPLLVLFLFLSRAGIGANRYWVAASAANWNNTANWSTTSGSGVVLRCQSLPMWLFLTGPEAVAGLVPSMLL